MNVIEIFRRGKKLLKADTGTNTNLFRPTSLTTEYIVYEPNLLTGEITTKQNKLKIKKGKRNLLIILIPQLLSDDYYRKLWQVEDTTPPPTQLKK